LRRGAGQFGAGFVPMFGSTSSSRRPPLSAAWTPICGSPTATDGMWPPTNHGSDVCSPRRFSFRPKRIDDAALAGRDARPVLALRPATARNRFRSTAKLGW
jgi:hypothetical protein